MQFKESDFIKYSTQVDDIYSSVMGLVDIISENLTDDPNHSAENLAYLATYKFNLSQLEPIINAMRNQTETELLSSMDEKKMKAWGTTLTNNYLKGHEKNIQYVILSEKVQMLQKTIHDFLDVCKATLYFKKTLIEKDYLIYKSKQ